MGDNLHATAAWKLNDSPVNCFKSDRARYNVTLCMYMYVWFVFTDNEIFGFLKVMTSLIDCDKIQLHSILFA